MSKESDNIQIEAIRNGDQQELGKIYLQYQEEFEKWATKNYQEDEQNLKEIYQTTIMIFYENIIKGKLVEIESSIKSYLFQIAKFKIYEKNRSKKNNISPLDAFMLNLPHEATVDEKIEKEKKLKLVSNGLIEIGDPCKSILKMFYFENKSMTDIAEKMSYKNTATVKNQKYKCLQRLIKIVKKSA